MMYAGTGVSHNDVKYKLHVSSVCVHITKGVDRKYNKTYARIKEAAITNTHNN